MWLRVMMVSEERIQSLVRKGKYMNCRGTETREKLANEYDIKPVAHIKLLAGQSKHSDAEAVIKDEYYIFSAKNKNDGNCEIIQCGMGAARDFLKILGIKGLPLFNPLKEEHGTKESLKATESKTNNGEGWDKTAKQLYNAIMWLIIIWDAKPNTPLFEFKDDIVKYKNFEPFDWKIKRVNTVIAHGGKGRTLSELINEICQNNTVRNDVCDFSILDNRMKNIKDKNGKTIKSFF